MCNAQQKGEAGLPNVCQEEEKSVDRSKNLFDTIPKIKLQKLSRKTIKSKNSTEKEIELKADKKDLFNNDHNSCPKSKTGYERSLHSTTRPNPMVFVNKLRFNEDNQQGSFIKIENLSGVIATVIGDDHSAKKQRKS